MGIKSNIQKRLDALSLISQKNQVIIRAALFILFFFFISCASGSGKFYDWCKKRDFPAVCKKYFD